MSKNKICIVGAGSTEHQKIKDIITADSNNDIIVIDSEKAKEMGITDKLDQSCIDSAKAMEDLNKAFARMEVPSKKKSGSKYHS